MSPGKLQEGEVFVTSPEPLFSSSFRFRERSFAGPEVEAVGGVGGAEDAARAAVC